MATNEEFREHFENLPQEIEASRLSQDALYDSLMTSQKLTESAELGELDELLVDVSDETRTLLGTGDYTNPATFYNDYSKIPIEDRRSLEKGMFNKDREAVEDSMIKITANKLSKGLDLSEAQQFLSTLDVGKFKAENIKDRKFQQAMFASDNYDIAVRLNDLHRNYDRVCSEFNAMWMKGADYGMEKGLMSPLTPEESEVPVGVNLNDYSNENIAKIPMSDVEKINYFAAKASYLNAKYNYPIDYVPGTPTDMGTAEAQSPFIAGAFAAAFAPASAAGIGSRVAYGVAGTAIDAPLLTGTEEIIEGVGEYNMPLGIATGVAALVLTGPLFERVGAGLLKGTAKHVIAKPSNTLQKMLKFSSWEDLKLSDDMYSAINAVVSKKTPEEYRRLLKNINSSEDGLEAAYKMPQTKYIDTDVEVVNISDKRASTAKLEMDNLEHNVSKKAVKEELDRSEFVSYRDAVRTNLKAGKFDDALDILSDGLDEAVDISHRIVDDTQQYITSTKTGFFHNAYLGLIPESIKAEALLKPNLLVHLEQGFGSVAAQFPKAIKKTLGVSPKNTKLFNATINRLDNGEISFEDVVNSNTLPFRVKRGVMQFRKFNDKMYDMANKHYSKLMNDEGIMQYGRGNGLTHVDIVRTTDDGVEVRNIRTEELFVVRNTDDLKPVTEAFPYTENFMHRHLMDNSWTISIKPKGKPAKVWDTVKDGLSAHNLKKELIDRGVAGKEDIIIHRIKDDANAIHAGSKNRSLVGVPQSRIEEIIDDSDKLNKLLLDNGISSGVDRIEFVDELVDTLAKDYGISNVKKTKYPNGVPSNARTRKEALSHVADPLDSMNAYSRLVGRTLIEGEYAKQWKAEFLEKFGEVLENPKDFTSAVDSAQCARKGINVKAVKLYQNQLMNYTRTPPPSVRWAQKKIDGALMRWFDSDSKAMHGFGKLLEWQQKNAKLTETAKFYGYSKALAFNTLQALLQSTWAHYGLTKNMEMFAKNPRLLGELGADVGSLGKALLTNQMGIKSGLQLSKTNQLRLKMIEDYGMLSNILGTEGGTGAGLISGMNSLAMAPVGAGEFANRLANIINTSMKAEKQGLALGTKQHAMYVAERFPRDAQVLNQMTNTPLTTSLFTSWNVGMFKKFMIQSTDAFWSGTTLRQKAALGVLGYTAFGKYGIPGAGEGAFVAEQFGNLHETMELSVQMSVAAAAENVTLDEAYAYIDKTYSNPEVRKEKKADLWAAKEAKDNMLKDIGALKLEDLLKDKFDPEREPTSKEIFMAMLSYEGYFDNALINVGYRSILEQVHDFGLSGMMGPVVQGIDRADFMSPMYNLTKAMSMYTFGEMDDETVTNLMEQETSKLFSAIYPPTAKFKDIKNQYDEVIGAIDKNELYDEEGNLVDWADIWRDPTLQLQVPYQEQKPTMLQPVTVKPTTSMYDMFMRVLGGASGDVRKIKKANRDKAKYIKHVLTPSIERTADLYDHLVAEGKVDVANQIFYAFSKIRYHEWGGTVMYPEIMRGLQAEVSKITARRTMGARPSTEYDRDKIVERVEEVRNVR